MSFTSTLPALSKYKHPDRPTSTTDLDTGGGALQGPLEDMKRSSGPLAPLSAEETYQRASHALLQHMNTIRFGALRARDNDKSLNCQGLRARTREAHRLYYYETKNEEWKKVGPLREVFSRTPLRTGSSFTSPSDTLGFGTTLSGTITSMTSHSTLNPFALTPAQKRNATITAHALRKIMTLQDNLTPHRTQFLRALRVAVTQKASDISLSFRNMGLMPEDTILLCEVLLNNENLETLDLGQNRLATAVEAKALLGFAKKHPRLCAMNLDGTECYTAPTINKLLQQRCEQLHDEVRTSALIAQRNDVQITLYRRNLERLTIVREEEAGRNEFMKEESQVRRICVRGYLKATLDMKALLWKRQVYQIRCREQKEFMVNEQRCRSEIVVDRLIAAVRILEKLEVFQRKHLNSVTTRSIGSLMEFCEKDKESAKHREKLRCTWQQREQTLLVGLEQTERSSLLEDWLSYFRNVTTEMSKDFKGIRRHRAETQTLFEEEVECRKSYESEEQAYFHQILKAKEQLQSALANKLKLARFHHADEESARRALIHAEEDMCWPGKPKASKPLSEMTYEELLDVTPLVRVVTGYIEVQPLCFVPSTQGIALDERAMVVVALPDGWEDAIRPLAPPLVNITALKETKLRVQWACLTLVVKENKNDPKSVREGDCFMHPTLCPEGDKSLQIDFNREIDWKGMERGSIPLTVASITQVLREIKYFNTVTSLPAVITRSVELHLCIDFAKVLPDGSVAEECGVIATEIAKEMEIVMCQQYIDIPPAGLEVECSVLMDIDAVRLLKDFEIQDPPSHVQYNNFSLGLITIEFVSGFTSDDHILFCPTHDTHLSEDGTITHCEKVLGRFVEGVMYKTGSARRNANLKGSKRFVIQLAESGFRKDHVKALFSKFRWANLSLKSPPGERKIEITLRDAGGRTCCRTLSAKLLDVDQETQVNLPLKVLYHLPYSGNPSSCSSGASTETHIKLSQQKAVIQAFPGVSVVDEDTDHFAGGYLLVETQPSMNDFLVVDATKDESISIRVIQDGTVNIWFDEFMIARAVVDDEASGLENPRGSRSVTNSFSHKSLWTHSPGTGGMRQREFPEEGEAKTPLTPGRGGADFDPCSDTYASLTSTGAQRIKFFFSEQCTARISSVQAILKCICYFTAGKIREGPRRITVTLHVGPSAFRGDVNGVIKEITPDMLLVKNFETKPIGVSSLMIVTPPLVSVAQRFSSMTYVECSGLIQLPPIDTLPEAALDKWAVGSTFNWGTVSFTIDICKGSEDDYISLGEWDGLSVEVAGRHDGASPYHPDGAKLRESTENPTSPEDSMNASQKSCWAKIADMVHFASNEIKALSEIDGASKARIKGADELYEQGKYCTATLRLYDKIIATIVVDSLGIFHCDMKSGAKRSDVQRILRNIVYSNLSANPQELNKVIRIRMKSSPTSTTSTAFIDLAITLVDNVTEVILKDKIKYRPYSREAHVPFCIAPLYETFLRDSDTFYFDGGVLRVVSVAGLARGDEIGIMSESQQREALAMNDLSHLNNANRDLKYSMTDPAEHIFTLRNKTLYRCSDNVPFGTLTLVKPGKDTQEVRISFLKQKKEVVTLSLVTYVMNCITFQTNPTKLKEGTRIFAISITDGVNPMEGKSKVQVEVKNPLIMTPDQTFALPSDGTPHAPFQNASICISEWEPVTTGYAHFLITEGFEEGCDQLCLTNDTVMQSVGHTTQKAQEIRIEFHGRYGTKKMQIDALLKAVMMQSKGGKVWQKKVMLRLDIDGMAGGRYTELTTTYKL